MTAVGRYCGSVGGCGSPVPSRTDCVSSGCRLCYGCGSRGGQRYRWGFALCHDGCRGLSAAVRLGATKSTEWISDCVRQWTLLLAEPHGWLLSKAQLYRE